MCFGSDPALEKYPLLIEPHPTFYCWPTLSLILLGKTGAAGDELSCAQADGQDAGGEGVPAPRGPQGPERGDTLD